MIKSRRKHSRGNQEFAALCRRYGFSVGCRHGIVERGGLPGLMLEVRRTQRIRLDEVLTAVAESAYGNIPVVAHRSDQHPWKVTLLLPDFLRLYGAYLETDRPDPESPASAAYPGSDPDSDRLPAETPAP